MASVTTFDLEKQFLRASVRFEFEKTGQEKFGAGGVGRLYINDNKVGEAEIPNTLRYTVKTREFGTESFNKLIIKVYCRQL